MNKKIVIGFFLFLIAQASFAETEAQESISKTDLSKEVSLLVNGIILDKDLFEYHLQSALQSGQEDSMELRLSIRQELYSRALFLEKAKQLGFTKNKVIKLMGQEAQENIYIDLVFQDFLKDHPITDEMIKSEYDAQIKQLGSQRIIVEYHLATIVTNKEEDAKEIILKSKSESFQKLAADYSIDSSAKTGGDLGWININQMQPKLKEVIKNIKKSGVITNPILIGQTWHVISVLDKRQGRPASFQESKDRMKQILTQKLRSQYAQELEISFRK